jgi:hypothetical protein
MFTTLYLMKPAAYISNTNSKMELKSYMDVHTSFLKLPYVIECTRIG